MRLLALSFVLLAAVPAVSQVVAPPPTAFEAQLVRSAPGALPSIDDLLARLRDNRDRKAQLEALDQIAFAAGRLQYDEELRAVAGLVEAYDNPVNEAGVRGAALDALGKSIPWFRDEEAARRAVAALSDASRVENSADPRSSLRVFALRGLSRAAGRLPRLDDRTERLVVEAGLDGMRHELGAVERTFGAMILGNYLEARGAGVIFRDALLTRRVEEEFLRPLEGGAVDSLYNDPKSPSDFRYFLMRGLYALAWTPAGMPDWRWRVARVLRDMGDRDPDPHLRELARLYAGRFNR